MAEGDMPPLGKRFSLVYLNSGQPAPDSVRMRRRMKALFDSAVNSDNREEIGKALEYELGISITHIGYDGLVFRAEEFFVEAELRDVLDSIGIIWSFLSRKSNQKISTVWLSEARRIFQEENLGYYLDDRGAARHRVDDEFHSARVAAISVLMKPRYAAVFACYEAAHASLDEVPPKYKDAARHAFEAVEILFKLLCPRAPRLGSAEIRQHLEPVIQKKHAGDAVAQSAAAKMMSGLIDWVDGVHNYRHGQGVESAIEMPADLAIYVLATAAANLRWLATFDQDQSSTDK